MAEFKGANKTKYDLGGTGDNIIPDGYIKTVEKVWMDSFTFSAVLTTADTVCIATIPANKKITGVDVYFPSLTPTAATITVGTVGDSDKFISSTRVSSSTTETGALAAINKVSMNNPDGFQFVTTAATDVYLALDTVAITAPTAGTITTVVKYT